MRYQGCPFGADTVLGAGTRAAHSGECGGTRPTNTPLLAFDALTDAQKRAETANPMGRIGEPEEVAAAVVFLAGPGATLFTGQCLGANGGAAMA